MHMHIIRMHVQLVPVTCFRHIEFHKKHAFYPPIALIFHLVLSLKFFFLSLWVSFFSRL